MRAAVMVKDKEVKFEGPGELSAAVQLLDPPVPAALIPPLEDPDVKEKKFLAEIEEKYAGLHRDLEQSFAEKEKRLISDLQARHASECRRLKREAVAGERSLLVELESKHEALCKELEASFALREKKMAGDLNAAADKELELFRQLKTTRRWLAVVILGAILSVVTILNMKDAPKEAASPASLAPADMVQVQVPPVVVTPSAVAVVPVKTEVKSAPAVAPQPALPVKAGNKGNFAGGMISLK
ncbi:MAG: hypothetical protein HQL19_05050 [Candidatus Omnitrophica bacterium]|nr:hypothetical protein [Candidatus Omnitrophota bacterium]